MMSEAELSLMKGRMLEGMRHKARRGALLHHPPMGYVRGPDGDSQLARGRVVPAPHTPLSLPGYASRAHVSEPAT